MLLTLFLTCFGLLFLTGMLLTYNWGRLAWRRAKALKWTGLHSDRYMVLATALAIESIGTSAVFGARAFTIFFQSAPATVVSGLAGLAILGGMSAMLSAKFGFMWAIELNRKNKHWIIFVTVTVLWSLFALIWALNIS